MKNGLVIKSTGSWYSVKHEGKVIQCKIKGKFRIQGIRTTNPVAVGDYVDFDMIDNDETGVIKKIHDRKNYIIRKSINLARNAHIIASNIDQAFLVVTIAFPETNPVFIDRFLVSAESYRIPVTIIFNKIDLYSDQMMDRLNELINIYEAIGYPCVTASAKNNINVDVIKDLMKNKVSIFSGNSGVGKSTLVNKLDSSLKLKTAEISDSHLKGKHTTTFAEMYDLPNNGGSIIDTPGIKGFGMFEMSAEDLSHNFPEMFKLLEKCQFNNCSHTHEPNCAVKHAVIDGEISESRYDSYISILTGNDDEKYR